MTKDKDHKRLIREDPNKVFNLLRENSIGNTEDTWEFVNVCYSFRCAVAHYGSIANYTMLGKEDRKTWAENALKEIEEKGGYDVHLMHLRWKTQLLIMRELVASVECST